MSKIRSVGKCKKCYSMVGYDSLGALVHVRHQKIWCGGIDKPGATVAVLKK